MAEEQITLYAENDFAGKSMVRDLRHFTKNENVKVIFHCVSGILLNSSTILYDCFKTLFVSFKTTLS